MSFNNHDNDDPNRVRYVRESNYKEDDLNGKAIKIYTMASTMPLKDFMKWFKESQRPELYIQQFSNALKQCQSDRDEAEQKIGNLEGELAKVKEESDRYQSDKEIVDFIMEVDWMGTKEFCEKNRFPVPFNVANNPMESARMFIDVDMKKWHVVKDFAKSKRRQALQQEPKKGGQGE